MDAIVSSFADFPEGSRVLSRLRNKTLFYIILFYQPNHMRYCSRLSGSARGVLADTD